MQQSKTVSNTACDKGTERGRSKYPPHLSSSNHPVEGRSTRQCPRTHQIWRQKTAKCRKARISSPVTIPRMNANAVPAASRPLRDNVAATWRRLNVAGNQIQLSRQNSTESRVVSPHIRPNDACFHRRSETRLPNSRASGG
ncbi:hypothetical protein TcG_13344 [Trypanosoma cruzi]|nr:hypothetical protein TcG_13344 [Trypanosoma cruzi]